MHYDRPEDDETKVAAEVDAKENAAGADSTLNTAEADDTIQDAADVAEAIVSAEAEAAMAADETDNDIDVAGIDATAHAQPLQATLAG